MLFYVYLTSQIRSFIEYLVPIYTILLILRSNLMKSIASLARFDF